MLVMVYAVSKSFVVLSKVQEVDQSPEGYRGYCCRGVPAKFYPAWLALRRCELGVGSDILPHRRRAVTSFPAGMAEFAARRTRLPNLTRQ